ncbi:hypothetical protein [Pseudofrankia sp. DC12]|uniref:type II secretion system F family protein n=1 Tax=Pseudofrankia sp. DC12 TaxID=683315 RepID=UPI0005F76BB1|nr:hypothetical protein [Pseudofrankia sp. DC12]
MSGGLRLVVLACAGGTGGVGVWLTAWGVLGHGGQPGGRRRATPTRPAAAVLGGVRWRLPEGASGALVAAAGGLAVGVLVGLPVLAVAAGGLVWLVGQTRAVRAVPQVNELGDAVASWCETVRQELDAGQPLLAAVAASCLLPPPPLAAPLAGLARRLEDHQPLPAALAAFHTEVAHPAVGQVVAALSLAYRHGAGGVGRLMAGQVETTRHRVAVLRDLHAGRARYRRAMSLLLGLFAVTTVVLLAVWPAVLGPYRSPGGQLVLAGLLLAVGAAIHALLVRSRPPTVPDFFRETP